MTTKAASVGKLGELHNKVAQVMSDALDVVDTAQRRYLENEEAVEPPAPVPAALLSVMVKFLSDNSVTCAPEESKGLSGLEQKLEARKSKRRVGASNVAHIEDYT